MSHNDASPITVEKLEELGVDFSKNDAPPAYPFGIELRVVSTNATTQEYLVKNKHKLTTAGDTYIHKSHQNLPHYLIEIGGQIYLVKYDKIELNINCIDDDNGALIVNTISDESAEKPYIPVRKANPAIIRGNDGNDVRVWLYISRLYDEPVCVERMIANIFVGHRISVKGMVFDFVVSSVTLRAECMYGRPTHYMVALRDVIGGYADPEMGKYMCERISTIFDRYRCLNFLDRVLEPLSPMSQYAIKMRVTNRSENELEPVFNELSSAIFKHQSIFGRPPSGSPNAFLLVSDLSYHVFRMSRSYINMRATSADLKSDNSGEYQYEGIDIILCPHLTQGDVVLVTPPPEAITGDRSTLPNVVKDMIDRMNPKRFE